MRHLGEALESKLTQLPSMSNVQDAFSAYGIKILFVLELSSN